MFYLGLILDKNAEKIGGHFKKIGAYDPRVVIQLDSWFQIQQYKKS